MKKNRKFLVSTLSSVADADDFTKKLLKIYESIPDEVIENAAQLGIHRSDYMLQQQHQQQQALADGNTGTTIATTGTHVLQIELNTIAASFAALSSKVGDLHRYLLARNSANAVFRRGFSELIPDSFLPKLSNSDEAIQLSNAANLVPENPSISVIARALASAHQLQKKDERAIVLFVVQPGER
jgi:glutathione synthase